MSLSEIFGSRTLRNRAPNTCGLGPDCRSLSVGMTSSSRRLVSRQNLLDPVDWKRLDRAAISGDGRRAEQRIVDRLLRRFDDRLEQPAHLLVRELLHGK